MQETSISWCDMTWNPVHGCSKVSPGCKNCYAEEISLESGHTDKPWTKKNEAENVTEKPSKIDEPHNEAEPQRIFVNSMSDLFHEQVSETFIKRVFQTIRNTPRHTYPILTKRPTRAASLDIQYPPNAWIGTSVESNEQTDRIETLAKCGADVLFISFEPLIDSVGKIDLSAFDWVIVGGENASDENRRDMDHSWARNIKHQARRDDVNFFFKQSSARYPETGTKLKTLSQDAMAYVKSEIQETPTPNEAVKKARENINDTDQASLGNF